MSWLRWNVETTFRRKAGSILRITLSTNIWKYSSFMDSAFNSPTHQANVMAIKKANFQVNNPQVTGFYRFKGGLCKTFQMQLKVPWWSRETLMALSPSVPRKIELTSGCSANVESK